MQSWGDPKLRHCASLGHVQYDETGLIKVMFAIMGEPFLIRVALEEIDAE